jgi:hypothetical protein
MIAQAGHPGRFRKLHCGFAFVLSGSAAGLKKRKATTARFHVRRHRQFRRAEKKIKKRGGIRFTQRSQSNSRTRSDLDRQISCL